MNSQDVDIEHAYMAQALPTPTDTPYRTPLGSLSRQSSHYGSSSPPLSSSPPPLPPKQGRFESHDAAKDESISILDPRRFTPTLHASLVSEILSLRRDLDSRNGFIEELERGLETARKDCEDSNRTLVNTSKETRSLRRQLQLLEGGTASALGELSKERDEAVESLADVRRRLETSQKKVRAEEENANRTQRLWDRDKQKWEEQRRNMERKVHIVEGRLKAILEEVAAQQAVTQARSAEHQIDVTTDGSEVPLEATFYRGGNSPSKRLTRRQRTRPLSITSIDSVRLSMLNTPNGVAGPMHAGISLADELGMGADADEHGDEAENGIGANLEDQKVCSSLLNRLDHDGEDEEEPASTAKKDKVDASLAINLIEEENLEDLSRRDEVTLKRTIIYVDSGSQFSPSLSPATSIVLPEPLHSSTLDERASSPTDHEANQGRKRVGNNRTSVLVQAEPSSLTPSSPVNPISSEPSSPPKTTQLFRSSSPAMALYTPDMSSSATQTDPLTALEPKRESTPPPSLNTIPSIAIHPPTSAPASPGSPVLPPRTKHAACQVSANRLIKFRSIAVQTEEIRIDKRAIKLPPHLLPSSISSTPSSPDPASKSRKPKSPPKKHLKRPLKVLEFSEPPSSPPRPIHRAIRPLDDGSLHDVDHANLPSHSSSLFAGFDIPSSDEGDDFEVEQSEANFGTALSAPRPPSGSQRSNVPVPGLLANGRHSALQQFQQQQRQESRGQNGSGTISRAEPSSGKRIPTSKHQKAGGFTSGSFSTATMGRRSPSKLGLGSRSPVFRSNPEGKSDTPPPFPVPTRSSSRWLANSASEGTRSPSRKSGGLFGGNRRMESGRLPANENLRKVRSATAIARRGQLARLGSRSPPPPPFSPWPLAESPQLPPLPRDGITTTISSDTQYHSAYSHQPSTNTSASVDNSGSQKEVIDAIAQTMVGEWMWKYVRKRKSFGVTESSQSAEFDDLSAGNGVRHKRWVWLSPYERAVLWSNKQPTTDTALLGKSGRKLIIQSVLDVRDDTPGPKQHGGLAPYNRSILILTPARALKFTATSRDRHCLWLTALSFLCRPSIGNHEVVTLPPLPLHDVEILSRRNPIRDSIRVAKGKARARSNKAVATDENHKEVVSTAADAPSVPRYSMHGRHRSNTGGRPPMGGLRSFTQPIMPSANPSLTNTSSMIYGHGFSDSGHRAPSQASSRSVVTNVFEAVGTVRMEAFVRGSSPLHPDGRNAGDQRAIKMGSHHQLDRRSDDVDESARADDPFRGF